MEPGHGDVARLGPNTARRGLATRVDEAPSLSDAQTAETLAVLKGLDLDYALTQIHDEYHSTHLDYALMQIYDDNSGAYSTHTQGQGSGTSAEEKWAPILSYQCGVTRFHDSADPDHNRTYARSHDLLDLKVVPKCKTGNEATQQ